MSDEKKRAYHSDLRTTRAAQTRERILLHAKQLFQARGFEGVTIEDLAKCAEVSMPTVYALFKSKRNILRVLMDEALPTSQFESLVAEARQEQSPADLLKITAKIARQIYEAEAAQMDVFRGASVLDPEFKILENEREQRRHQRLEITIKTLKQQKSLLQGLTLAKAHDILWALTGRDLYRMLVVEQGWTANAYEVWLSQFLVTALLEPFDARKS